MSRPDDPYAAGNQPPPYPPPYPQQGQPAYPSQQGQPPPYPPAGQPPSYPPPQYPPTAQYPSAYPPAGPAGAQAPPPWGGQGGPMAPAPLPDGPPPRRSLAARVWPKVAGALGVLLIIAAIGAVRAMTGSDDNDGGRAYPTASHPSGTSATSTAEAEAGGPFAGSPAEKFPEGAAGITLPKAAKTGAFSAKQVSDALAAVKKALIAGRLDERMLVDRDPENFLKLLAPDAKTDLRKDFTSDKFSVYATQFARGAKLADAQPRVKGRITYRASKTEGIRTIEVTTNFVWVYPFEVSSGDGLVVVHDELKWQFLHPSDVEKSSRGLWLDGGQSYAYGIDCDQFEKGLVAPGKPEPGLGAETEDPDSMFDPERSLDVGNNC